MKTVAIVQARMGSTRFPNKVMQPVLGTPLIELLLGRLSKSRTIDQILLATSDDPRNQPLVDHVRGLGYEVFQGSEAGFIGLGVGAAMMGLRPVMELMFWSFAYVAFDQIINNAGCVRYMSGGLINLPLVIRGPANGGTNVGATHSHTPENFLANTPGLKVVCPATPYDAKGLMKTSIRDNDPVCFMENTLLYGESGEVPEGEYLIPLGVADIKREGADISLIGHGRAVITALRAADRLAEEYNISAEVIDLRSIRPLDEETILDSVRKTHRAVLVDENKPFCGVSSQIATLIQEQAFDDLDAPVQRVCSLDAPAIYSPAVEELQLPTTDRIISKVLAVC